jgi:hypothetical protein
VSTPPADSTIELRKYLLEIGGGVQELLAAFRNWDSGGQGRVTFSGFKSAMGELGEFFHDDVSLVLTSRVAQVYCFSSHFAVA